MKNSIILISLLSLLVLGACTKADESDQKNVGTLTLPIASFTYTIDYGSAVAKVTFNNTSQYSDQFLWTFHNGSTSNDHSPTFNYPRTSENETYLVILKATDTNTGESNTRSKSVLIESLK